jgi:hypothetical protein
LESAKAVLRRTFIAVSSYIKISELFQINDLMMYFKLLEKQEEAKHEISRWKEMINTMAEISEIENKRMK